MEQLPHARGGGSWCYVDSQWSGGDARWCVLSCIHPEPRSEIDRTSSGIREHGLSQRSGCGGLALRLGHRPPWAKEIIFRDASCLPRIHCIDGGRLELGKSGLFRFLTGAGIGGEYAAINSTIQELIPAKFRGRTDLLISGTFWIGAGIGAMGSTVLLDPTIINPEFGWRIAFLIGALLALVVLRIRRAIPESPRWLMTHQRLEEANAIVSGIEEKCGVHLDPNERLPHVHLIGRESTPLLEVVQTLFCVYPRRALVSFSLMAAQALVYNAIFFTYSQALTHFFNIPPEGAGYYFLFFAAGNFLGPLVLGRLFDTFGRKRMIAGTYAASGVLLAISGYLFMIGAISGALAQALFWMVTFFFASAAASAAYLTAGEIFPLEIRALAIAFFFAVGTALGGVISPWLFSSLVAQGPERFYSGYLVLSAAMMAAAAVAALWGVPAERKSLEEIARPLTFVQ
jgi:MFS family permease